MSESFHLPVQPIKETDKLLFSGTLSHQVLQVRLPEAGGLASSGDKVPENSSLSVSFMGWTGKWNDFSTSALLMLGVKGLILCVISMLPHFLCYIPAYAMLLLYLFRYPVSEWNSTKTLSFVFISYYGNCISLVNPVLLKMFLRTL